MNGTIKIFLCLALLYFCCTGVMAQKVTISHYPYLQNLGENEVSIVWLSNKPTVGWVELAPDDSSSFYLCERPKYFDTTNGVKKVSDIHTVRIKGLEPGVSYRYRVFAQEVLSFEGSQVVYGKVASTNVYKKAPLTFTTNDRTKKETSFVMINDIHGRKGDISRLLKAASFENKDMIFFNGDMLSYVPDRDTIFSGFMDESIRLFAGEKPMYYARGNHETRGVFATEFQQLFSPHEPNLYFMFRQGPVCFLVLDTGEDKPDSDIEYSGITDYDTYRTEQAAWLKEAVQSKDFQEATYRIVIAHMPPLTDKKVRWHGQDDVLRKFVPVLNEAGIDVMLCGHLHRMLYQPPSHEVKFPVWVNSWNTVMEGCVKDGKLSVRMRDMDGKIIDEHLF